jgi:branched-chain amino acid transport system ATP-binding protein
MVLLRVKEVHVEFGNVKVLDGISFEVIKGTILAIIGANGAGKTTTLRTISGLTKPTRGEIQLDEQPIHLLSPQDIVRLGVVQVPEGRRVFPYMSVLENLKVGAYLRYNHKSLKNDLKSIYEWFPILRDRKGQLAGSLSGGEQQMLAIARALMAKPTLLLLDEPSLGLAPLLVETIGTIISTIYQQGVTILLVEQNAMMALKLASVGYVFENGKIALFGESKTLMNNEHVRKAYLGI